MHLCVSLAPACSLCLFVPSAPRVHTPTRFSDRKARTAELHTHSFSAQQPCRRYAACPPADCPVALAHSLPLSPGSSFVAAYSMLAHSHRVALQAQFVSCSWHLICSQPMCNPPVASFSGPRVQARRRRWWWSVLVPLCTSTRPACCDC